MAKSTCSQRSPNCSARRRPVWRATATVGHSSSPIASRRRVSSSVGQDSAPAGCSPSRRSSASHRVRFELLVFDGDVEDAPEERQLAVDRGGRQRLALLLLPTSQAALARRLAMTRSTSPGRISRSVLPLKASFQNRPSARSGRTSAACPCSAPGSRRSPPRAAPRGGGCRSGKNRRSLISFLRFW